MTINFHKSTAIKWLPLLILAIFSCKNKNEKLPEANRSELTIHPVTITEVIKNERNTLARVIENGREYWICTEQEDVAEGKMYIYSSVDAELLPRHECEVMSGAVDSVWMVKKLIPEDNKKSAAMPASKATEMPANHSGGRVIPPKIEEKISPENSSVPIADVFRKKSSLNGKKIKVRGKVVKVNANIMGRNWVHLQDGSQYENEYDLTLTTRESVEVGKIVVFEGTIAIDKDFTAGYIYPVILEDAVSCSQ